MVFELGKKYKHSTGKELTIVGLIKTYVHGVSFCGEDEFGELSPVGMEEENTIGWELIKEE